LIQAEYPWSLELFDCNYNTNWDVIKFVEAKRTGSMQQ